MKNVQIANAKLIYEASKNDKLVIIVGSGVSSNSGIPMWKDLVKELKEDLPKSVEDEYDALKIAQLHQNTFGFKDSIEKVKRVLDCEHAIPNKIHKAIFDLNPCNIITTNYDCLLENYASNIIGNHYSLIRRDSDIPYASYNNHIIKMHGDFVDNNIVLTENDYINYSQNFPLISCLVQSLLATKTVLCVGYSFNDPDLKMLLNTVRTVLKQNSPRIFMLADFSGDTVNENYLKNQGVYPIWIDETDLDKIKSEEVDLSGMGLEIYRQLCALQRDLTIPNNMIDHLFEIFSPITSQMPYLVLGMKDLIPKNYYTVYNLHSSGIQIESAQIKDIKAQTKSKKGIRQLIGGREDKVHYLLRFACQNGIDKIDNLMLSNIAFFERCINKGNYDAIDYIYEFDYKNAYNCINTNKGNAISFSHKDLMIPYAYWSLGYYSKAFIKYKELSKEYSKTSNHILFFLCMHSQRMLANAAEYENISNELSDIQKDLDEIRKVDFDKLIDSLNVSTSLKLLLKDISNFGMYLDVLTESKELERNLLEDKLRSDNGGWSNNSHIPLLWSKVRRVFNFSKVNYVVTTNNKYANEVFRSGITGLLLSHKIKDHEGIGIFGQSRLEEIEKPLVLLMLFSVDSKTLEQIFKDHSIDTIILSDDAVRYLETCIENISNASTEKPWEECCVRKYIKYDKFRNQLSNLMFVCLKATNQISNINKIVDIVINNKMISWRDDIPTRNFRLLIEQEKLDITEEQANKIFEMFDSKDWGEEPLPTISNYMSNKNFTLSSIDVSFLQERNVRNFNAAATVYPIAPQAVKEQIEKWILESDFSAFDQDYWQVFWGISGVYKCDKVVNRSGMDAYLAFRTAHMDRVTHQAIATSRYIAATAKAEGKDGIVEMSMNTIDDDLYKFFMSPNSVDDDKVEPIWIFYLDNERLKEYLSVPNHKSVVKSLIDKNNADGKYLMKRVNKLFLEE